MLRNGVLLQKVKSSTVSLLIFDMPLRAVLWYPGCLVDLIFKVLLGFLQKIFKWNQIRAVVRSFVLVLELQDLRLQQKLCPDGYVQLCFIMFKENLGHGFPQTSFGGTGWYLQCCPSSAAKSRSFTLHLKSQQTKQKIAQNFINIGLTSRQSILGHPIYIHTPLRIGYPSKVPENVQNDQRAFIKAN